MDFAHLIEIAKDGPVFETGLLLAVDVDPDHIRRDNSHAGRRPDAYTSCAGGSTPLRRPVRRSGLTPSLSPTAWCAAPM